MSSPPLLCVFCNDKFESKDSLAQHFRTHATGAIPRSKYVKAVKQNLNPKTTIKCDVCTEEFNTTTDAISHKYKKHRDAPIQHFCAWCGKQFPIKHIWELHQETHAHEVKPSSCMSCEICNAEFYDEKACTYHQKSFHRKAFSLEAIDTPPPSKKISVNSHGDVLSVFYCPFCGVEYIIKYNLQKHILANHPNEQENPPTEVVKCTICDAHFYNEKAYNFHTSYHKTDDLYVTSEEMRQRIVTKIDLDFDFRRVKTYTRAMAKPSKKKMNTFMDKVEKNYFQIGDMSTFSPPPSDDDSDEDNHKKEKRISKKRKHDAVSSSSEAITLDQFVNMNKEIFSDCFDINPILGEIQEDVKLQKKSENNISAVITEPSISGTMSNSDVNIDKVKKDIIVKKISVPAGAPPPGVKVITVNELKKMKQQGIVLSVVSKPPPVLNALRKILGKSAIKPNTSVDIIPIQDLSKTIKIKAEEQTALLADVVKEMKDNPLSTEPVENTSRIETPEVLNEVFIPSVGNPIDSLSELEEKFIRNKCINNKAVVVVERDPRIHSSTLRMTISVDPKSLSCKKPSLKTCQSIKRRMNSPRSVKNIKHYNILPNVGAH